MSGRSGLDHISVLEPGRDGLYGLRQLELTGNYQGAGGQKSVDLHGFDVHEINQDGLQFWIINHRPPLDSGNGRLLADATAVGANSTIEVFELSRGASELEFVKTITSRSIVTPNNIAALDQSTVLITNDHRSKG